MNIVNQTYTIGLKGVFCFKDPYDTFFKDRSDILTVGSLTSLGEIYANSKDPYALYYANMGVSEADYKKSLANNDIIVGFRNSMDTWYYVPSGYITGLPVINGISYTMMGISITLGAIKTDYDLSGLITTVGNVIKDNIGIDAIVQPTVLSSERLLSITDSTKIEAARKNNKTKTTSTYELQNMLIAARNQISLLEQYIACTGCEGTGVLYDSSTNLDCNGNAVVVDNSQVINTIIPDSIGECDSDPLMADTRYTDTASNPITPEY